MPLIPANPNTHPEQYSPFWFRFFEILPGACVWTALLAPFILSYIFPLTVTLFIIVFDVYWLVQAFNYGFILIKGYERLNYNLHIDWRASLQKTLDLSEEERVEKGIINWNELYNAVILTTYKEELEILEASIASILEADFPKKRMLILLATEEREGERAQEIAHYLQQKYRQHFFRFLITIHPDNIVGEVKAKGANVTWAAKVLSEEVEKAGIAFDRVIVSTADGDSRFSPNFFLCLSYAYATLPNRIHCCYQPIATYFNNIWEAPMVSRVLAFGDTFWTMIESVRNYRLISFSTHAMGLQTLKDIDYWCTSIVNEDSRQYFRGYFHYHGDFQVIPLFMPIYMDAVHVEGSLWNTLRNLYFQKRRWAYGVEHFPYIVLECLRHPEIPRLDRFMLIWRAFQGAFSWATSSFFISVVGWLPIVLNVSFRDQVVVSNFSVVTSTLLSFTWIGILISSIITLKILNLQPHNKKPIDFISMILQWALLPIAGIFFSALPGLHAQTCLMLGKYLGFRVTQKSRHPNSTITLHHETS